MRLLYKKCEVCGTDINKLQSWWNIYMLKTGAKLKCSNCGTEYKTNKVIRYIGSVYVWFWLWVLPIFYLVKFIDHFHLDLGIEVWLYAICLYSLFELLLMVFLPLKKIENKE